MNNDPSIVLRTYTSTPDDYGRCECAVLRVTAELVDRIRKRAEIALRARDEDPLLYELYFWNNELQYYDDSLISACEEMDDDFVTEFQNQGRALLAGGVDLDSFEPLSTECDQMIVRVVDALDNANAEVAWTAAPKHSDTYVTTEAVTLDELERHLA